MSLRALGGFIRPGYNPLRVPNAPTIGTASQASLTSVSVPFTAPSCVGGGAITGYTAVSSPGCKVGTASSSPITVGCLTTGTAYTFRVYATNSYGPSAYSASSNSVTPAQTCATYTTPGVYSWVAPAGVTSVSVVVVGGGGAGGQRRFVYCPCGSLYFSGGGGGGGGLAYINNYSVTPGNSYILEVGAGGTTPNDGCTRNNGGLSCFAGAVRANGGEGAQGSNRGTGRGPVIGTGYSGGNGGVGQPGYGTSNPGAGGGGAGGYAGNGGQGAGCGGYGTAGSGGAGGGGGGGNSTQGGGGGGGVGLYGQGSNGAGGLTGAGGGGGSGGTAGASSTACVLLGGSYGGGGGGTAYSPQRSTNGGGGAIRIVWPGTTRQFPSTNVGA